MPARPSRTMPLAPVLAAVERYAPHVTDRRRASDPGPIAALAAMTGVSRRTIHRYALQGIPWWRADVVAVALGFHPLELWPDWLEGPDPTRPTSE